MSPRGKITLLTFFFAICGTAAVFTAYLQDLADQNVKPADLYSIVVRQLQDLHGHDFSKAYEYASHGIQSRYSQDQFAAMVQASYPGMTRVARAEFGAIETRRGHATMQVYLIGDDGLIIPCVYMMVREGESWRIDGARLMPPWPPNMRMEGTML